MRELITIENYNKICNERVERAIILISWFALTISIFIAVGVSI